MDKYIKLNVYGIGIFHPRDWQIFINPNNKFTFNEGLIKVDKVTVGEKKKQTSLSIRWAKMKQDITVDEYVEELENQFSKKEKRSRHKDQYKILEKSKCIIDGKEAYILHQEFVANHSIYRFFGKEELVKVLQVLFFSKETQRMLVATLLTTPEELQKNEGLFKEVLSSLHEDLAGKSQSRDENLLKLRVIQ